MTGNVVCSSSFPINATRRKTTLPIIHRGTFLRQIQRAAFPRWRRWEGGAVSQSTGRGQLRLKHELRTVFMNQNTRVCVELRASVFADKLPSRVVFKAALKSVKYCFLSPHVMFFFLAPLLWLASLKTSNQIFTLRFKIN